MPSAFLSAREDKCLSQQVIVTGQCLCTLIILSECQVDASYMHHYGGISFMRVLSYNFLKLGNQRLEIFSCLILRSNQENGNTTNI